MIRTFEDTLFHACDARGVGGVIAALRPAGGIETALITGGLGGIGYCTARAFRDSGLNVIIVDIKSPEDANLAIRKLRDGVRPGTTVAYHQADVTDVQSLTALHKSLKDGGTTLNHVVSLAGGLVNTPAETKGLFTMDPADIIRTVEFNGTSHLLVARILQERMVGTRDCSGSFIMIGSICTEDSYWRAGYAGGKGVQIGALFDLTAEFGASDRDIRAAIISPGTVMTERTRSDGKNYSSIERNTPLSRIATAEEVAAGILVFSLLPVFNGVRVNADVGQSVLPADYGSHRG